MHQHDPIDDFHIPLHQFCDLKVPHERVRSMRKDFSIEAASESTVTACCAEESGFDLKCSSKILKGSFQREGMM
jgi:hypothetical protein